jgi:hypothetical protein
MVKLEEGMKQVVLQQGRLPPIVVRDHPDQAGQFEIIDGFHRWKVVKKLKRPQIDIFSLGKVTESMARILTVTFNRIHGESDPDKYPVLIAQAIEANPDLSLEDLAKLLPETADQLQEVIDSSQVALDLLADIINDRKAAAAAEAGDDDVVDPERWVTLKFNVPVEVAAIIERELDRIEATLAGKERRMRALEFAFVNSSLTPLEDVQTGVAKLDEKRQPETAPKKTTFHSDIKTELAAAAEEKPKKPKKAPKKAAQP